MTRPRRPSRERPPEGPTAMLAVTSPPGAPPRPAPSGRPAGARRIPWGWLEWFLLAQTLIPALLFIPGVSPVRSLLRVAAFGLALLAWIMIVQSGRSRPGADTFSANTGLKIACGWLLLSVFNPGTISPPAGLAHAMLYIAVFSPAFWAHSSLASPRQLGRLMAILLICNGLSALVGLGQVFRPATFNPPVIAGLENKSAHISSEEVLTVNLDDGTKFIRPCGLTDQAGSGAVAGSTAVLIGLAMALRRIGILRRLVCLGLAFVGVAVIYYSQVRMILIMLVLSLAVLTVVLALQRDFVRSTALGLLGVGMIVGAFIWVAATSGAKVTEKFGNLVNEDFAAKYQQSRGGFVREAFEVLIWDYPIGAGLGLWGQVSGVFGVRSNIWVEVMWPAWIIDGGIPLLAIYLGAIGFALHDTLRIALRSKDRDVAFWAAVVLASNLSVLATCFSYITFLSGIGLQFWLFSAVVHAADRRVRDAARRPGPAAPARPVHPPLPPYPPSPGFPPTPPSATA